MASARVDDDKRPLVRVNCNAWRGDDAHQTIVHGPLKQAPVRHHLPVERQKGRLAGLLMFEPVVAPLPERVPEQQGALDEVARIQSQVTPNVYRRERPGRIEPRTGCLGGGLDVVLHGRRTTALVDLRELGVCRWDLISKPGGLVFWGVWHRCLPSVWKTSSALSVAPLEEKADVTGKTTWPLHDHGPQAIAA